jgi:uncharacterized membrane protein YeaQ/YmgE (transglycosylase-associated protein family)
MAEATILDKKNKMVLKFKTSGWINFLLVFLSIAALTAGFLMGLELFEALGEFKRLGIFIIFGSIIGAVLLLAIVKILNDLAYIKNKLDSKN